MMMLAVVSVAVALVSFILYALDRRSKEQPIIWADALKLTMFSGLITSGVMFATSDGSAVVVGTIINDGVEAESLLGLSVNNVLATLTATPNQILNGKPMIFEGASANAKAVVPAAGIRAGKNVEISFFFKDAGVVTVKAIARDQRDIYAGVTA